MLPAPVRHPFADHEDELVERARERDTEAFAALVLLHGDRLHRQLVRMLGDVHDAEEVGQEALIRAWRGLPAFNGDAQFSTWLYRIASNEANRRLARDGRMPRADGVQLDEIADEPANTPPAIAEAHELEALVATCVTQLPPHYREVISLIDMDGRTNDEASGLLQIGIRNVKSRLHRARMAIRRCVEIIMR